MLDGADHGDRGRRLFVDAVDEVGGLFHLTSDVSETALAVLRSITSSNFVGAHAIVVVIA
jgi:hypothetical protein